MRHPMAPGQPPTGSAANGAPLLSVRDLVVSFPRRSGPAIPVDGIGFDIQPGERIGLVGESGSGKSLTATAVMGLVPRVGGALGPQTRILYKGEDLARLPEPRLRRVRGGEISMIFQDPLTSLNPVHNVGRQVLEAIELNRRDVRGDDARSLAVDLLRQVRLRRPERLMRAYPHELSGGMRQRVMIAIALAGDPSLLIADEPTTALDVTIQAGILDLLHELGEQHNLAVMLITHDLGIVAGFTNRVLVMYGGRIMETSTTDLLYRDPRHPYTSALLSSVPPLDRREHRLSAIPGTPPEPASRPQGCVFHPRCNFAQLPRCADTVPHLAPPPTEPGISRRLVACVRMGEIDVTAATAAEAATTEPITRPQEAGTLVSVRNLTKTFRIKSERGWRREVFTAISDVSLDIAQGECLGIVGESGSGKSTLARCLLRLVEPTSGEIAFRGQDVLAADRRGMRLLRREMQMIFQDPGSSLDPRMRVGDILAEPLRIHSLWNQPGYDRARLDELIRLVSLPPDALERYPHQFSGGQRQRISIARALALRPKLLVCDEPVSALDVSVRSSILNLLADLQTELGVTLVFIAHDLALVRFLCHRIGVMYQGELVELADNEELFESPRHPHTKELLAAHPVPDPKEEHGRRRLRLSQLSIS